MHFYNECCSIFLWLLDSKVYRKFPVTFEKTIENWNRDHLEIGTHHSVTGTDWNIMLHWPSKGPLFLANGAFCLIFLSARIHSFLYIGNW